MTEIELWALVSKGGDIAIYAVLYYCHNINSRVNILEVKYGELKGWVSRLDTKMHRARKEDD